MPYQFCTHFDRHYLAQGLVLYQSLVESCPDFRLRVFCMDADTKATLDDLALPNLTTIGLEELERRYPRLVEAKQTRTRLEYIWTATPATCLYVLESDAEAEHVIRIDTDLCFFADPAPLFEELGEGSVLLTPHRLSPEFADSPEEPERWGGVFNVQFEVFRRDQTGIDSARWWLDRCVEWCYDRFEPGRYGDQKYLEELPRRFPGVKSVENPGAGLAPWNVAAHRLEGGDGRCLVDGRELIFHHFQSLELHEATPAARRLARRSRAYRVTQGPVPLVWTTGWRLTERQLSLLWEPYLTRLSQALADLRAVGGGIADPPPLAWQRAAFNLARRRVPIPIRDAYWKARELGWALKGTRTTQAADDAGTSSRTAAETTSNSPSDSSG